MDITYDQATDVLYINLEEKAEFGRNQKIDDNTILDFDVHGELIGVEVLFVSDRYDIHRFSIENLPIVKRRPRKTKLEKVAKV